MRPLSDIRVVDLTRVMSGPFCTAMLADLGADVIKVEPTTGDITRHVGGHMRNGVTAMFLALNRGKRSFVVDLRRAEGVQAIVDLVATADVFVENFRPGVADEMGLGADRLRDLHPGLIYLSISGYGRDGAMAGDPAYDIVIQGQTGMLARQSAGKGQIDKVRSFPVDKLTGMFAAQAVLAGLLERGRTGTGCAIDVPMFDAAMYYLWSDVLAEMTFADGDYTRVADTWKGPGASPTADGHIVWLALSLKEIHGALRSVGRADLVTDPRFASLGSCLANKRDLDAAMASGIASMTSADVVAAMKTEGVAATVVLQPADIVDNADLAGPDFFVEWEHDRAGEIRQVRPPIRFDRVRSEPARSSPELGEHTDAILRALGYSEQRRADMRTEGVIR